MRRVQTLKTPQQQQEQQKPLSRPLQRKKKETFPDGLEVKHKRYGVPVTSTPKPDKFGRKKGTDDVRNCFGFDESEDENNYSALMSPIPTEDPVTRIPGLDAALKRKNAKRVDDVQVLQENNSKSPDVAPKQKEKVDLPKNEENSNKPSRDIFADVETAEKDTTKPPDPEKDKPKVVRTVKKGRAKTVAPRKQPTRSAKNSLHPSKPQARMQVQELYQVDDFEASQKSSQDLNDNAQSAAPCSDIYIKTGNPGDGFNAFLARYGKVDEESDEELHVNTEKIIRTYSSHNCSRAKVLPSKSSSKKRKKPRTTKSNVKTLTVQDESDDSDNELDPVLKKWLEEKNKEFEDVLHVPLIVAGEDPPKSKRRVTRTRKTKT